MAIYLHLLPLRDTVIRCRRVQAHLPAATINSRSLSPYLYLFLSHFISSSPSSSSSSSSSSYSYSSSFLFSRHTIFPLFTQQPYTIKIQSLCTLVILAPVPRSFPRSHSCHRSSPCARFPGAKPKLSFFPNPLPLSSLSFQSPPQHHRHTPATRPSSFLFISLLKHFLLLVSPSYFHVYSDVVRDRLYNRLSISPWITLFGASRLRFYEMYCDI